MRTTLDCMVCFMQQALSTARLSSSDSELHHKIVNATGNLLSNLDLSLSPPENAVAVYKQIVEMTGVSDPFYQHKIESNSFALRLRDQVRERIENAENSLYAAVCYAIAGNIIDYGVQHEFDALDILSKCMENDFCIDDFELLSKEVNSSEKLNILYLADNCGEIVFDGLLVEQLQQCGHVVTLVVRGDQILNDVTMESAVDVGIDNICTIISNGTSCPGTPLGESSGELQKAFSSADLIISKGQGNFETLSGVDCPIYYLLTVKCSVVAKHIIALRPFAVDKITGSGEFVLMKTSKSSAAPHLHTAKTCGIESL
jgi:uncharacterized protein with ATP-grasp and redox domains